MNEFMSVGDAHHVPSMARGVAGSLTATQSRSTTDAEPLCPGDIALADSKVLAPRPVLKATPFEQRWSVWGGGFMAAEQYPRDLLVVGKPHLSALHGRARLGLDYRVAKGSIVALHSPHSGGKGLEALGNPAVLADSGTASDCLSGGDVYAKLIGTLISRRSARLTQHGMRTTTLAFDRRQAASAVSMRRASAPRGGSGAIEPNAVRAIRLTPMARSRKFHRRHIARPDITGGGYV